MHPNLHQRWRVVTAPLALATILVALLPGCGDPAPSPPDGGRNDADGGTAALSVPRTEAGFLYYYAGDEIRYDHYEVVDGYAVVEGDTGLGTLEEAVREDAEIRELLEQHGGEPALVEKAILDTRNIRRWPDNRIRVELSKKNYDCRPVVGSDSPAAAEAKLLACDRRARIMEGIALWNEQTYRTGFRVEIVTNTGRRTTSVLITHGNNGCITSRLGYRPPMYRRTEIHLASGCYTADTVAHEIGHAIGFQHEQRRGDAPKFTDYRRPNQQGQHIQFESRDHLPRRFDSIGPYDVLSLMHYQTDSFSRGRSAGVFPSILSRDYASLFTFRAGPSPKIDQLFRVYNPAIRPSTDRGIKLEDVRVVDVGGNSVDDLLTTIDGVAYWSEGAATQWIQLRVSGNVIHAGLPSEVELGELDANPGMDVVTRDGSEITMFSSDGSISTGVAPNGVRSWAVGRTAGVDTLFVLGRDGRVRAQQPGAPPGTLFDTACVDASISEIDAYNLRGTANPSRIVGFSRGVLKTCDPSQETGSFAAVFSSGNGPLPSHVDRLQDVWFVELEDVISPTEPMDIVSWRAVSRDTSGGAALYVLDVLDGSSFRTSADIPYARPPSAYQVGLELADRRALLGRFRNSSEVSAVTLGVIPRNGSISRGDLGGLVKLYGNAAIDLPMLTTRYPMTASMVVRPSSEVWAAPLGSRFPLEAGYANSTSIHGAERTVERFDQQRGWVLIERVPMSVRGEVVTLKHVYNANTPGRFRVRMRAFASHGYSWETAEWQFNTVGDVCGDAFLDPWEVCDDANRDNLDHCRNNCVVPICGDGIVDGITPYLEICDDGNSDNFDGCRNSCRAPFCQDGIVDPNESCDDGNAIDSDVCRNDCTRCGDGILQSSLESCDDGNTNNNDACRNDCTRCGDGIVQYPPEQCDPPIVGQCSSICEIVIE